MERRKGGREGRERGREEGEGGREGGKALTPLVVAPAFGLISWSLRSSHSIAWASTIFRKSIAWCCGWEGGREEGEGGREGRVSVWVRSSHSIA